MAQRRREWCRSNLGAWRALYVRIRQEIRDAKRDVARNVEQHDTASVQFAKGIKSVMGFDKKGLTLHLYDGLREVEISDKIRDFFAQICTEHPALNIEKLPSYLPAKNDLPDIERYAIYTELTKIKLGKASPEGEIPKRLLKEFSYELSEILAYIFNLSLRTGVFPDRWKEATITPLPKVKVVSELGELRPISLTPDLGKILEGLVTKVMLQDIKPSIDERQYGNLKGRSTSHYLIFLIDEIYKALDKPHTIATLTLIDFKKAFDFVDHTIAVTELIKMGCRSSIIPFIISFLTRRRHRVRYKGATSARTDHVWRAPRH